MTHHGVGEHRYGKLFPALPACQLDGAALEELASAMTQGRSGANRSIPAGYTYLGQFIDHDLTFDTTSQLGKDNDPAELTNLRSPRLDLDSLYGSGRRDQPYLYSWPDGVELLADRDLQRNSQGRALIGDPRNDENQIVSQLHLLFVRFHNKVAGELAAVTDPDERFAQARQVVRWHYQSIVMHDFLPLIVGEEMAAQPPQLTLPPDGAMPVEFSAAAYRFGHSMVRENYRLNDAAGPGLMIFGVKGKDLTGFDFLPHDREIEWHRFFLLDGTPPAAKASCR